MVPRLALVSCLLLLVCGGCSNSRFRGDNARTMPSSNEAASQPYQRPPQLEDGWQVGAPEDLGLAGEPLERMTEALRRDDYPNVHAVLIAKGGRLIYEEHFEATAWIWEEGQRVATMARFDRDALHEVRSVTKSVASAVFGIAMESGAIGSVDEPLFDYFPDYAHLATPEKKEITLRDVLTMSAGFQWVEVLEDWDDESMLYANPNPAEYVLSKPLESKPGTSWYYNGGLTTLLGLVVGRATGESFGEYARTRLFEPLGITYVQWGWQGTAEAPRPGEDGSIYASFCCRTAWQDVAELRWEGRDPWSSVAMPSAGLWIRPRDLLKFGSLYLNGGRWGERQVVPQAWVETSLAYHIDRYDEPTREHGPGVTSYPGYGYQWWHTRYLLPYGDITVHTAQGNGGQRIWIVPELDLVAVQVTSNYNLWYASYQAERLVLERIVPWALGVESGYRHEIARPVRELAPGEWPTTTLTAQEGARYVGVYDFAGERLEIHQEKDVLRLELPGQGEVDLLPAGDHVFAAGLITREGPTKIYWPEARLYFMLDEGGEVSGYQWRQLDTGEITSTATRVRR